MKESTQLAKRLYKSLVRENSSLRTRERILKCAYALLREEGGAGRFSLEAVANRAGITRATIYKGFGSRRLLLEAVFDLISDKGGLELVSAALLQDDPAQALLDIVSIFCRFWGSDTATLVCLHATASFDKEFEQSLIERNERRRIVISMLVKNICAGQNRSDLKPTIETLFALTSLGFYQNLASQNSEAEIIQIVQELCLHVLQAIR
jgi:AcrR family transcriptional regulator